MPDTEKYIELNLIGPSFHGSADRPSNLPVRDFFQEWINDNDSIAVTTSGSTGTPKNIHISKAAMIESAKQTIAFFNITSNSTLLLCLPVDFIAGKMMVVRALVSKAQLCYRDPSINPFLDWPKRFIPPMDFAAFTPQQVTAILSDAETRKHFVQIRTVIIGGGEIPYTLEKKLAALPNHIYATYGMTETITHVAVRKISPIVPGGTDRIYKVFKGIRIGLDDRQCLTIQAPYLGKDPIVTNDIVELQGPHEFSWLGRYDNVVNSGGIKLFPEKLEEPLRELIPHDFFLAGLPDEVLGEKLVMVIESEPYDEITLSLLRRSLRDILNKYQVPKDILFVPVFERTETNKIRRKETLKTISR